MQLSAVVIAKNEEEVLDECLGSLSFCDEIIVIEGGSTDRTKEIAIKHGARVVTFATSNFSKAREMGIRKAKGDWVLYVDADERVTKELMVSIKTKIAHPEKSFAGFYVTRKNFYFGNYEWPVLEKLERLFQKRYLKGWYGALHESPRVEGKIGKLEGVLLHFTHRNLSAMVEKTLLWSETEARLRFDSHHPKMSWWRFPRVMLSSFYHSFIKQGGWKVGTAGLIESFYQAYSSFVTYAKLWELQQESQIAKSKSQSE